MASDSLTEAIGLLVEVGRWLWTFTPSFIASSSMHTYVHTYIQTGERVRDTATKFGLVLSSSSSSTAAVKSISDEMRGACDTLVASLGYVYID